MPAQTVIKDRRDTAANWTSANPTLAAGEHGFETDTGKFKIGDGTTAWTSLGYAAVPASGGTFTGAVAIKGSGTTLTSLNVEDNYAGIELKSSGSTGWGYIDFADAAADDFDIRLRQNRGQDAVLIEGKTSNAVSTSDRSIRNIFLSTSAPSGGSSGDVWLTYTA